MNIQDLRIKFVNDCMDGVKGSAIAEAVQHNLNEMAKASKESDTPFNVDDFKIDFFIACTQNKKGTALGIMSNEFAKLHLDRKEDTKEANAEGKAELDKIITSLENEKSTLIEELSISIGDGEKYLNEIANLNKALGKKEALYLNALEVIKELEETIETLPKHKEPNTTES